MKEKQYDDEMEIDLLEIAKVLWKKAGIIILCFIIGALGSGIFTKFFVTPMYQATATIYALSGNTTISVSELQLGSQLSLDFQELATRRTTLKNTLQKTGLEKEISIAEFAANVTVANPTDTRFIDLSVTNENPENAQKLANALAHEVADRVVTVMSVDKPTIAEKAIKPLSPISPSLAKNTLLGGLVGMIIAMGIIILRFIMDDSIKNEEDVRKYLNLNVLASLPDMKERRKKD